MIALLVALSGAAHADEGPPPECPVGQHEEYRAGHKCVPDGWHLAEHDGVVLVNDATGEEKPFHEPPDPPVESIHLPVSPAPPAEPAPAEPAPAARAANGCGCESAGTPSWAALLVTLAMAAGATRRARLVTTSSRGR